MTSIRIRPRFHVKSDLSIAEIRTRFEEAKQAVTSPCQVVFAHHTISVMMPAAEQHFWSPHLGLTFEEEYGQTTIRGHYGPKPSVWTIFAFAYSAIGMLFLFALIYGCVQLMLDVNPWALWSVLGLGISGSVLYFASQAGQKMSVEDTFRIHLFTEGVLGQKIHIH
ncbi:hypothetical protein BFP72_18620 [Reichenbachiella sp. 5M10]|nr:hypothetical protein BFP72_18620 [Reichenbachiella sp. 5M10]